MRREEQLASLFTIDIEFHAVMRNHFHVVLRTSPRAAKRLGREEVVRRWLTITRWAKCMSNDLPEPDPKRIEKMAKNKKWVEERRRRLSDISWFMGNLCENISRRSNAEAGTSGHFWGSRFKCRECLDTNGILLCGIYVDLNPIKAGEAASPEKAIYTSIHARIQAQSQRKNARDRADGWMGELTLLPESKANEALAYSSHSGRRASDMGILPMSLEEYLRLLKWTAKLLQSGERKTIPCTAVVDCGFRLPTDAIDGATLQAGDAVAPRTIYEAVLEGRRAALAI